MSELVGQVRAVLATRRPDARGQPGLFGTVLRPADGPLAGHVLKTFRGGRDPELLEQVARRHETYLDCLRRAGLEVPATRFLILNETGFLRPVVVQEAVPAEARLGRILSVGDGAVALEALDRAATAVSEFWRGVAQRTERIGLNAGVRHLAFTADGRVQALETAPPLITYSREEMGRLMLRFTESGVLRGLGTVLPGRAREVQDAWYSPAATLGTLIEGALRLRPRDRGAILDWARGFAAARLDEDSRQRLRARLERPRGPGALPRPAAGWRGWRGGARPNA